MRLINDFKLAWSRLRTRAAALTSTPVARRKLVVAAVAWLGLIAATVVELWPMLRDFSTFGFQDWDVAAAYRHITRVSLREYHQFPWWNPWLCGGFPGFGFVEGATNLVSPYLPFYLLADVRSAIRIEVLGSTLIGLAGAYLLARRFTRSVALCTLVAALAFLNNRWTLQAAVGHGWHLAFCWMPWALWSFDRALEPGHLRRAVHTGIFMALMIFSGAIYPVPYTALALAAYAGLMVLFARTLRPIWALGIAGLVSFGLGAPKLLAIMDNMSQAPRLIQSREVIGLADMLVMLTNRAQSFWTRPLTVPAYHWHEWGIYVGAAGLACMLIGLFFSRGPRENALRMMALACMLLGFGAFTADAPWALLHRAPVFSSLHVPSRFHFPMVLLLAVCFAAWAGPTVARWLERRPLVDLVLLLPVALIMADVVIVGQRPFAESFTLQAPAQILRRPQFEHANTAPINYVKRDAFPPVLLAMMANTGVIQCYGVPPSMVPGAKGIGAPGYRGNAWVASGVGSARVVEWSPNRALVKVEGAAPGSLVVYNMNWDPGWTANGRPALQHERTVAAHADGDTIEFRYRPRTLGLGLGVFLLTVAILVGGPRLARYKRSLKKRATSNPPASSP